MNRKVKRNSKNKSPSHSFKEAIYRNKPDLVQEYIKSGISVETSFGSGFRPIHVATNTGGWSVSIDVLNVLIDNGADLNSISSSKRTALHMLSVNRYSNWRAYGILLNAGANPELVDIYGFTPLMLAFKSSNIGALLALSSHGVKLSLTDLKLVNLAKSFFSHYWYEDNICDLKQILNNLDLSIDEIYQDESPFVKSLDHRSFYYHDLAKMQISGIKLFSMLGADPNILKSDLKPPLVIAIEKYFDFSFYNNSIKDEYFYELLAAGSSIDIVCGDNAPIHLAIKWHHLSLVEMMIDKGFDFNVRNKFGMTPLDCVFVEINKLITESIKTFNYPLKLEKWEKLVFHLMNKGASFSSISPCLINIMDELNFMHEFSTRINAFQSSLTEKINADKNLGQRNNALRNLSISIENMYSVDKYHLE